MRIVTEKNFLSGFSVVFFVYSFFIVFGAFSGNEIFFNYLETERWGVKGIIISGNEASGFLVVALFWALIDFTNIYRKILLLTVVLACLLVGTKASILLLFLSFFLFFVIVYRLQGVLIFTASLFFSMLVLVFFYNSVDSIKSAVDSNFEYFLWHFDNTANESVLNIALTGRDTKLAFVFEEVLHTSPWSFVVGGYPIGLYQTEMDFFDLLFLSGIFLLPSYIYLWFMVWGRFSESNINRWKFAFCITFFGLGFLAGHFFNSAVAGPLAAALCIKFAHYENLRVRKAGK